MAEIISGALTTSENESIKQETKAINLINNSISYDGIELYEVVETPDEYVHWVTFGIGGPA